MRIIDATNYGDRIRNIMACWNISPCLTDAERTKAVSNLKVALDVLAEMPTISPDSLVKRGRWDWREEWETHPETHSCDLINCGWYCTECGIELGDYLTKKIGQHVMLDDDFRKPKLARCPSCGALMED